MIALRKNEIFKMIEIRDQSKHKSLLQSVVQKLDIKLEAPENQIVIQGTEGQDEMYFVQQGECNVIIKDKVGLNQGKKRVRTLHVGDYFGEVSLIYKCRRSAYV